MRWPGHARLGADAIELHTGRYAHAPQDARTIDALRHAARAGADAGLAVHAGHGLTVRNVGPVAAVPEIEELNIGHSIVSRSVFIGIEAAVREMRERDAGSSRRVSTGKVNFCETCIYALTAERQHDFPSRAAGLFHSRSGRFH